MWFSKKKALIPPFLILSFHPTSPASTYSSSILGDVGGEFGKEGNTGAETIIEPVLWRVCAGREAESGEAVGEAGEVEGLGEGGLAASMEPGLARVNTVVFKEAADLKKSK